MEDRLLFKLEERVWRDMREVAKRKGEPAPADTVDKWRGPKPTKEELQARAEWQAGGQQGPDPVGNFRGQSFRDSKFGGKRGWRNRGGRWKRKCQEMHNRGESMPTLAPHLRGAPEGHDILQRWKRQRWERQDWKAQG